MLNIGDLSARLVAILVLICLSSVAIAKDPPEKAPPPPPSQPAPRKPRIYNPDRMNVRDRITPTPYMTRTSGLKLFDPNGEGCAPGYETFDSPLQGPRVPVSEEQRKADQDDLDKQVGF